MVFVELTEFYVKNIRVIVIVIVKLAFFIDNKQTNK